MDMCHSAALPSHCCMFFEKYKKHHYKHLDIIFKWTAGARLGVLCLCAGLGFLVLILSNVYLKAGVAQAI